MVKEELTDQEKWQLDTIIMHFWDAKTPQEKRKVELECYKEFKSLGFNECCLTYLRDNDADVLADEMEHFAKVHDSVPHEHEERRQVA
ncbi:MAG: hypothetical protein KDK65_00445 [Chlamydiia bacterium]|nr:hypothetical protein [Chlamydiia bacterium]